MKKISLLWVALAAFALGACNKMDDTNDQELVNRNENDIKKYIADNNLSAVRDSSDLYYAKNMVNPTGRRPKLGEEVAVNFTIHRLTNGVVVGKTDSLLRFPFGLNLLSLPGIERSIYLLRNGEKGTFLIPFYLMFGKQERKDLPAASATRLELELVQVRNEAEQIADYIANQKLTVSETTESGVRIVRLNTVTGDSLGKGKTVDVNYLLRTINGEQLEKNVFPITTGAGGSIRGFDEGVRRLRPGEKAILIFPSSLGYGTNGKGNILPYAPLVFEVEVPKQ